jgi:hypothetical protein
MPKDPNGFVTFPVQLSQENEWLFEDLIDRPWGICRDIREWSVTWI